MNSLARLDEIEADIAEPTGLCSAGEPRTSNQRKPSCSRDLGEAEQSPLSKALALKADFGRYRSIRQEVAMTD